MADEQRQSGRELLCDENIMIVKNITYLMTESVVSMSSAKRGLITMQRWPNIFINIRSSTSSELVKIGAV